MATDNSTTLLSNVSNSANGKIKFTIKVPKGYKAYYEVLPANAKTINGSQSVISTDYDTVKGTVDNTDGTATKTVTLTKSVKLYGSYKVRVGIGAYYNGNSSLRQSKTVKSTMKPDVTTTSGKRNFYWTWTETRKSNYENEKGVALTLEQSESLNLILTIASGVAGKFSFAISVAGFVLLSAKARVDAYQALLDNVEVGEYVGYRFVENADKTNIKIYLASYDSNKNVKKTVLLTTLYHSNYIHKF